MNKIAFVDFDGTIVNVFPRYYGILSAYLEQKTDMILDFDKYKDLKRAGKKDHEIVRELINGLDIDIERYVIYKRERLECFSWLLKDKVIVNPQEAYLKLKEMNYKVILLTQRNNEKNLYKQIEELGIGDSFDDIVVVKPIRGINVKASYIEKQFCLDDIIIGDSIVEIEASRTLGIKGYFVETGLFCAQAIGGHELVFENYNLVVDYILNNKDKLE